MTGTDNQFNLSANCVFNALSNRAAGTVPDQICLPGTVKLRQVTISPGNLFVIPIPCLIFNF